MKILPAVVLLAVVLATTSCTTSPVPTPSPSPSATPATTPATAAATSTPAVTVPPDVIVVGTEELSVRRDGETVTVSYTDGAALLQVIRDVTGQDPAATRVPPYHDMDLQITRYSFTGIVVSQQPDVQPKGFVWVQAATVAGIPVVTAEGLGVGSSVDDALAAGAVPGPDYDGDGEISSLSVDRIPVDGADSLSTPGAPGSVFVQLNAEGGVIDRIDAPSSDFGDI